VVVRRWYILVGILLLYVLVIITPVESVGAPLRIVLFGALLEFALRTRRHGRRGSRAAIIVTLALAIATIVAAAVGSKTALTVVAQASIILLVCASIAVLGLGLVQAGSTVDANTVTDVLSVYLLLALLFAALHQLFGAVISPYLNGAPSPPNASDTLYFSIITMTTVGFGDVTPASNVARAVASTEAIVGQLYLVSVVAVVVSHYRRPDRGSDSGQP
jgi:hypothetical protein